jgi:hypothetical protein
MTSMRALLLPPVLNNDDEEIVMPPSEGEQQIAANFAVLTENKKRNIKDEKLALETATLVEQEVQRWQNSIHELEALLEEADERSRNPAHQRGAPHPIPALVALDDHDSRRIETTHVEHQDQASVHENEED